MKISPWFSSLTKDVYHDDDSCPHGKAIEERHRVPGTGNLPRCEDCARVS